MCVCRIKDRFRTVVGSSEHLRMVESTDRGGERTIIGCKLVMYSLTARIYRPNDNGELSAIELEGYMQSQT